MGTKVGNKKGIREFSVAMSLCTFSVVREEFFNIKSSAYLLYQEIRQVNMRHKDISLAVLQLQNAYPIKINQASSSYVFVFFICFFKLLDITSITSH